MNLIQFLLGFAVYIAWNGNGEEVVLNIDENSVIIKGLKQIQSIINSRVQCNTTWMKEYTIKHKALLTTRRLVHVPFLSGLADRIIGMVTSTAFALLTNRAIQSGKRHPLPPLEAFFTSPYVNWSRDYDEDWILEVLKDKANPKNYNASVLSAGEYNAIHTLNDYKLLDKFLRQDIDKIFGNNRNVMFLMNRGKTIRLFENTFYTKRLTDEMQLTPDTAFGCITSFLIEPKPEIFASLSPVLEKLVVPAEQVLKIGIHIRAGDAVLLKDTGDGSHFGSFFKCASEIEGWAKTSPLQKVIWYLATDSRKIREYAISTYGDKILTSLAAKIEHSSKELNTGCTSNCSVTRTGFQHAAAEWWMMGACDYFVVTLNSGYGRSAAMRSLRRNSIYTIREDRKHPMKVCDNTSFTDLENLSYDWSGI